MSYSPENFEKWNKLKQELQQSNNNPPIFKTGEIWFVYLGLNLGYEEYGKGELFLRPVLILRKFNKYLFFCVPFTSKLRISKYNLKININGKDQTLLLSQSRAISSRRLLYLKGKVDSHQLNKIKENLLLILK